MPAAKPWAERWHGLKLRTSYALVIALIVGVAAYGFDYYFAPAGERPFSPKHALLRSSGPLGLALGILGTLFFLVIFLYPIRKSFAWLRTRGNTRHWLDFHVLLGLTAPFIIVLHAAFKFGGLAGMAFWIMLLVSISGVVGRYLYSKIPRRLNAAELSLQEARDEQARLTQQLAEQKMFSSDMLRPLFHLPAEEKIRKQSILIVLLEMVWGDFRRFYGVAALRRRELGFAGWIASMGGLVRSGNEELERIVALAKKQASISQRLVFLTRTHQVFHLWHVVHKPFSYAFAVLVVIHIGVVLLFGIR